MYSTIWVKPPLEELDVISVQFYFELLYLHVMYLQVQDFCRCMDTGGVSSGVGGWTLRCVDDAT